MKNDDFPTKNWDQLTLQEIVASLEKNHKFGSSGESRCVMALVEYYKQRKEVSWSRDEVYRAINSERAYQDKMTEDPNRPDMVPDLHLGDTLTAMRYNLDKATEEWYKGSNPHKGAMNHIRKICGLGVQIGEKLGMPKREK